MLTIYLLIISATIIWFYLKYIYSYWERKGFPNIKPNIPFGNIKNVVKREKSFGSAIYDLYYENVKLPFIGIYFLFRPALLIRDAELAKTILTSDFASFHDRGIYSNENDPMSQNLFALPGTKWKSLRNKLSPAFSSGKLKNMFETISNVSRTMADYLNFRIPSDKGAVIEMKDVCSRYAVDIIANVIFGIECNSFAEPNNKFRRATQEINNNGFLNQIRLIGSFLCPGIFKIVPISRTDPYIKNFMIDIVKETISYRENTNYVRKDFMQLLLQLRNGGKVNADDSMWDFKTVSENLKSMPVEVCAAQAFLFYVAGSESTSSLISYCLHELTQNKEIMENVVNNIQQSLDKHNGLITYDSIQDMKYLDLCIMETLRKYPGLPILNRECTKDFKVPNSEYVIEKGTPIVISLLAMQRDPKYFPEPLKFDPERYIEGKNNYTEAAYMPFGEGPRSCIAIRLGRLNAKVALVMLLTEYEFEAIEKKEIEFATHAVSVLSKDGVKLMVSRRKKNRIRG